MAAKLDSPQWPALLFWLAALFLFLYWLGTLFFSRRSVQTRIRIDWSLRRGAPRSPRKLLLTAVAITIAAAILLQISAAESAATKLALVLIGAGVTFVSFDWAWNQLSAWLQRRADQRRQWKDRADSARRQLQQLRAGAALRRQACDTLQDNLQVRHASLWQLDSGAFRRVESSPPLPPTETEFRPESLLPRELAEGRSLRGLILADPVHAKPTRWSHAPAAELETEQARLASLVAYVAVPVQGPLHLDAFFLLGPLSAGGPFRSHHLEFAEAVASQLADSLHLPAVESPIAPQAVISELPQPPNQTEAPIASVLPGALPSHDRQVVEPSLQESPAWPDGPPSQTETPIASVLPGALPSHDRQGVEPSLQERGSASSAEPPAPDRQLAARLSAQSTLNHLCPPQRTEIPGIEFAISSWVGAQPSGVCYDIIGLPRQMAAFLLVDIPGPVDDAAVRLVQFQTLIRSRAWTYHEDLSELAKSTARGLAHSLANHPPIAFFYARPLPGGRCLQYLNAGHFPPLLLRRSASGAEVTRLHAGGPAIGTALDTTYQVGEIELGAGDLVAIPSRSLVEAVNSESEPWTEHRLVENLLGWDTRPVADLVFQAAHAVEVFTEADPEQPPRFLLALRPA